MTLDTHQVLEPTVTTTSSQLVTPRLPESQVHTGYTDRHHGERETVRGRGDAGREVVAGVSAAALVFLGVVLTATWRWRHRLYLPHNKLIDEESDAPNLYRGTPDIFYIRINLKK